MIDITGNKCIYCKIPIQLGETVIICDACGLPHHKLCWEENRGCRKFGCVNQYTRAKISDTKHCDKCNSVLQDSHVFCPQCGQKVAFAIAETISPTMSQYKDGVQNSKSNGLIGLGLMFMLGLVVMIVVLQFFNMRLRGFQEIFPECSISEYCSISYDGSIMKVISNSDELIDEFGAWDTIQNANKALGFSSAVSDRMINTTSKDGRMTESNDNYTVSWQYIRYRGLEAIYVKRDK